MTPSEPAHPITEMITYQAMASRYDRGIVSRLNTVDHPLRRQMVHVTTTPILKMKSASALEKNNGKSIIVVDGE